MKKILVFVLCVLLSVSLALGAAVPFGNEVALVKEEKVVSEPVKTVEEVDVVEDVLADDPNTPESSTMVFEGSLTDNGGGTYSGTIPMINEAGTELGDDVNGFDVYAENGAQATYDKEGSGSSDYACGSVIDNDAYTTAGGWGSEYDPDCADWYNYQLRLENSKWYLEYNANVGNDDDTTGAAAAPMSGNMDWSNNYALETGAGAYYSGMGSPESEGYALDNTCTGTNDGRAAWDMDWSWGSEYIPLERPGFDVTVEDLGSGNYRVTLVPAYTDSLLLENKEVKYDENLCGDDSWSAITGDGKKATLYYNSYAPAFEYMLDAEGLNNEEYVLIYYADDEPRFEDWGGNPALEIARGTASDGLLTLEGSIDTGNLPYATDWNADPDPDYCDCNNGHDDYEHCSGAKFWLIPADDYDAGNEELSAWNPDNYLFETDLATYTELIMQECKELKLAFEAAYQDTEGTGYYHETLDFNGDGVIDLEDFSLLGTHYRDNDNVWCAQHLAPLREIDSVCEGLVDVGFMADGILMQESPEGTWTLTVTNDAEEPKHNVQFKAATEGSENLLKGFNELYLGEIDSTLKSEILSYYETNLPNTIPGPDINEESDVYRTYLIDALNGDKPFAYIKTNDDKSVELLDGLHHYYHLGDVSMLIDDDYPAGTFPITGDMSDMYGNICPVEYVLEIKYEEETTEASPLEPSNVETIELQVETKETPTPVTTKETPETSKPAHQRRTSLLKTVVSKLFG